MTSIALLLIAVSLHAQDIYEPTRPAMRRGPELATVSPSRQAAIAKALINPDPHDLMVLLGMPDQQRESMLVAAIPQPPPQPPPRPIVRPSNIACMESISGNHTICPSPAVQPPASLVQPPPGPVLALNPDVAVTVSPMSRAASERILGKRIGKIAMVWLVTVENRTLEPVLIAPSAIYRHVSHLQPFDHVFMSQLIEEGAKNGVLARTGRVADDTGKLLAFAIASKAIQISEVWPGALVAGAVWAIPQFIQRLKGAETPVAVNFERLAWTVPIALGPSETANAHIFSEIWTDPSPVSFALDVSRVQLRKSLQ